MFPVYPPFVKNHTQDCTCQNTCGHRSMSDTRKQANTDDKSEFVDYQNDDSDAKSAWTDVKEEITDMEMQELRLKIEELSQRLVVLEELSQKQPLTGCPLDDGSRKRSGERWNQDECTSCECRDTNVWCTTDAEKCGRS
jgi:hypothetical protein